MTGVLRDVLSAKTELMNAARENGKFKERLRIDPPTPPDQKGPNTSHYHLDGKGKHYSAAPGDKDPGLQP